MRKEMAESDRQQTLVFIQTERGAKKSQHRPDLDRQKQAGNLAVKQHPTSSTFDTKKHIVTTRRKRIYSLSDQVIHVRAQRFDVKGEAVGEPVHFSFDPNLTTLQVLKEILSRAFKITREFVIRYLVESRTNEDTRYLPMLSDYDLNAATSLDPPDLYLRVDFGLIPVVSTQEEDLPSSAERTAVPIVAKSVEQKQSMFASWASLFTSKLSSLAAFGNTYGQWDNPHESDDDDDFPLTKEQFCDILDEEGRLIEIEKLRSIVLQHGVDGEIRKLVWPHLLATYPQHLTEKERLEYDRLLEERYEEQKMSWQKRLKRGRLSDEHLRYSANSVRKDVIRTDRSHPYFSGGGDDQNGNVLQLFNILYTYALCHPKVGYCQGMSDLAAPLLVVAGTESAAYMWLCALMRRLKANFCCEGRSMTTKFSHLCRLLRFYDAVFFDYLKENHSDDLLFCYRWLLLELKREFVFDDALRVLETMWAYIETTAPCNLLSIYDTDLSLSFDLQTATASESLPIRRSASPEILSTIKEEGLLEENKSPHGGLCHAAVMRSLIFGSKSTHRSASIPSIPSNQLLQQKSSSGLSYPPMRTGYGRLSVDDWPMRGKMDVEMDEDLGPIDLHLRCLARSAIPDSSCERRLRPCRETQVTDEENVTNESQNAGLSGNVGKADTKTTSSEYSRVLSDAVAVADEARDEQVSGELTLSDIYDICVAQTAQSELSTSSTSSSSSSETRSRQVSGTGSGSSSDSGLRHKECGDMHSSEDSGLQSGTITPSVQSDTLSVASRNEDSEDRSASNESAQENKVEPLLPRPDELGDQNPFLMFLCLTLLLEHRHLIMRRHMDFNDMAMFFDKLARRRHARKTLKTATLLYKDYLKSDNYLLPPSSQK